MTRQDGPIDVFISYKREERDVAEALAGVLARRGYTLWWDIELLPGERFADAILAVINRAKAVVVLWSNQAVASDFVRAEAREADKQDKLIPIRLDDCDLPLPFGERQTLDLQGWWPAADEASLEPLLRALDARIGKPPAPAQPPEETEANLRGQEHEAAFWRAISERQPQSAREYELYLQRYPAGVFVDLARLRIEDLQPSTSAGETATMAVLTLKNSIIALGAVAVAGTAMLTFWDQILERCESLGWCIVVDADGVDKGPADTDSASQVAEDETAKRKDTDELPWTFPPDVPVPDMVPIPPDDEPLTFTMGSRTGNSDERPTHDVTIAEPFYPTFPVWCRILRKNTVETVVMEPSSAQERLLRT